MRSDLTSDAPSSATPHDPRPSADPQHLQGRHSRWGQSLGLAALFDDLESLIGCGDVRLLPNSAVRWVAMRNAPLASGSSRSLCCATITRAVLRFGMPQLGFARQIDGCSADFRFIPGQDVRADGGGRWRHVASSREPLARESAVLNRLRGAMSDSRTWQTDSLPPAPPSEWFPTAYLGFRSGSEAELYRLAARQQAVGSMLRCRHCDRDVEMSAFGSDARSRGVRRCTDGSLQAECPACCKEQKWLPDHAIPAHHRGHVPIGFTDRFCRAVADRLPLASIRSSVYCGSEPICRERDWPNLPDARTRRLDLLVHRFRCGRTAETRSVYLPRWARVQARQGQPLQPGQAWCHVLAERPNTTWQWMVRSEKCKLTNQLLGGEAMANHLRWVWFDHQGLTYGDLGEHQRLWPAELVAFTAAGAMRPLGLYWDFRCSLKFLDERLAAATFPALRIASHRGLRGTLPGDVALDASVAYSSLNSSMDGTDQHRPFASLQMDGGPRRRAG